MRSRMNVRARNGTAILAAWLGVTSCISGWSGQGGPPPRAATQDQMALDKLMAPIALYPDALLAQVLACATSPQQVVDFDKWMHENESLQGSQRQEAAEQAGFDASFIAIALFPDVVAVLAQNIDWTTELGKAFISDQKAVLESAQRLRAQASAVGNLKTTPQQVVTTETQGGQQVIVIQPANPQVVYVPVYNPQVVYVSPPPPSTGSVVVAGLIGFGLGIAIGAALNDHYYYGPYGWGAWGCGWRSHTVIIRGGPWRPPVGRYPYARPMPYYRPNVNVYAPRYSSVNINRTTVNNVNVNHGTYNRTPRATPYGGSTTTGTRPATNPGSGSVGTRPAPNTRPATGGTYPSAANRPATGSNPPPAFKPKTTESPNTNYGNRGYGQTGASERTGTKSGAFSGYQSGKTEQAASARGKGSLGSGGKTREPKK